MSTHLPPTPGQTVGPFFGYALPFERDHELVPPGSANAIWLHGTVTDGNGAPVPDALIELWQAGGDGEVVQRAGSLRRDGRTFTGWGRSSTDDAGEYRFSTVRPGDPGTGAPFFHLTVFARGLMHRLFTRAYLPESLRSDRPLDGLLGAVDPARRRTLVADQDEAGYCFDIVLQGEDETVFVSYPGH